MAIYNIEPERRTLHGLFSRDLPPILTIDSGDSVVFHTLDGAWGLEPPKAPGRLGRKFSPRIKGLDDGHALCGPVAVRGAEPGMTLQVQINQVRPGTWGWTRAGGRPSELNVRLGMVEQEVLLTWALDVNANLGQNQYGHTVALRPFMGVMGMPPNEPGTHPTAVPRLNGGNIDCRELIAGSTLLLPIAVPGALFSLGDGHAAQADGEAGSTGIECPMERVDLTFHLREELHLTAPRAEVPAGWVTLGFHQNLNDAAIAALEGMLDLMQEQYGLDRTVALAMASLVVELRITQMVNGISGVHALLPHHAIIGEPLTSSSTERSA